ncbi:MAG: hypothetical protein HY370_06325 [Proteobacteria bacterium]|nr:hypothetical protein [Pseudomonadota bacterium]
METNASFAKAAGEQPAHRLKLRLSTYEDGPHLVKFYRANQHPEVALRKEAVIRERATNGRAFIYEDEAGEIIASSITYVILQGRMHAASMGRMRIHAGPPAGPRPLSLHHRRAGHSFFPECDATRPLHRQLFEGKLER